MHSLLSGVWYGTWYDMVCHLDFLSSTKLFVLFDYNVTTGSTGRVHVLHTYEPATGG